MRKDIWFTLATSFLLVLSMIVLGSIAPNLFPLYFVYLTVAILAYVFFSQVSFDVVVLFSKHFYIFSLLLLLLTLIIGSVTRGTIRWIPIGPLSIQPAEFVRPFLLVFFADYLTSGEVTLKKFAKALALLAVPTFLILVQPSLGVSILTVIGFLGVLIASKFDKKYVFAGIMFSLFLLPIFWFLMAPYQKQRVMTYIKPTNDALGSGYNSLQSVIAAGSGKFFGRGLGKGIQTQLAFLPERQTDFIFASTAEELGFFGSGLMLFATFIILYRLTFFMENTVSPAGRAYISGFFLTYLAQVFIHAGMNLGLLPVTGLPFPLVSAGGTSLLSTMIGLGIALGAYKR
jgi:rod shape determining protein RodA